jgi:RNA polymerase sigma-70 factor, ECF subfamily
MKSSSDYPSYDDETLIRLITQGREEALAQLYDRYNRLVFSLALAIVNDRATAEEITLDVFMRVWQRADTYQADRAKVSTWLTHIARHHAIDILRRRAARPDQQALRWEDVSFNGKFSSSDLQETAEVSSRRQRVHAALAQLPQEQRHALLLAYFGGYTQREIAEALKQPLGTIKTRIRLAMQRLRDYLRDEKEFEDKSIEAQSAYNMSKKE